MTPEEKKLYKKRRQAIVRMHDRKTKPMTFKEIADHFTSHGEKMSYQRAHQLYHLEKSNV